MQTTQFAQLDTSVLLIELTFTQNVEMEHTVLVDRVKLLNALQGNLEQMKPSISDKMLVVFHVVQDNIVMQNKKIIRYHLKLLFLQIYLSLHPHNLFPKEYKKLSRNRNYTSTQSNG